MSPIRPYTTCLYLAAFLLLRSLSAVSQSLASKPRLAALSFEALPLAGFFFARLICRGVVSVLEIGAGRYGSQRRRANEQNPARGALAGFWVCCSA